MKRRTFCTGCVLLLFDYLLAVSRRSEQYAKSALLSTSKQDVKRFHERAL